MLTRISLHIRWKAEKEETEGKKNDLPEKDTTMAEGGSPSLALQKVMSFAGGDRNQKFETAGQLRFQRLKSDSKIRSFWEKGKVSKIQG